MDHNLISIRFRRSRLAACALSVAAILCVVAVWSASSAAHAGRTHASKTVTLHVYEKARSLQLKQADGRVLKQLPLAEPQAGDTLDAVFDVFEGNHKKRGKKPIGSDHLRCEFIATGPPKCVSHAVLGSSMLVVEGFPGRITFGTGKYFGATGRVLSSKEVKAAPPSKLAHNDIDVVVRINRR